MLLILIPGRWKLLVVGLYVRILRAIYLNVYNGLHIIYQCTWLNLIITRYWSESEVAAFVNQTVETYKNITQQPTLQVNMDKLLEQLFTNPYISNDPCQFLQVLQQTMVYLCIYYPTPKPPT